MATGACARRVARSSVGNTFRSFMLGKTKTSVGVPSSAPPTLPFSSLPKRCHVSRLPRILGSAESLMPLHSVTASALLTSMLSDKSQNWGWLSEGFATPL
ncbi:uncharacterized protein LOC116246433 [Nymphaea colorata]|nr:uncharacterized protein LOC116246433 [Nymphaea colorata]